MTVPGGDVEPPRDRLGRKAAQQQLGRFPFALGQEPVAEILEALGQATVHALPLVRALLSRPALPQRPHGRVHDRPYLSQAVDVRFAKRPFTACDHERKRRRIGNIDEIVDLVAKVSALTILAIVFGRMKPVGRFVAVSTDARLLGAQGELIERVQQVGTGEIAIEIVRGGIRLERVVQNFRRREAVEREQAGALVLDDRAHRIDQRRGGCLATVSRDQARDAVEPAAGYER